MKHFIVLAALLLGGCAAQGGLNIKEMGSFHVGGREHTVSGQPIKTVTSILTVFGDFIEQDSRWPTIKGNVLRFLGDVGKAGGKFDVIDLPKIGITGNSHMMMMDRNSDQVAGVIQKWLAEKGFVR